MKQCLDIRVVRLQFQGIPEENEEVDVSICYPGTDLLIATERTALLVRIARELCPGVSRDWTLNC